MYISIGINRPLVPPKLIMNTQWLWP